MISRRNFLSKTAEYSSYLLLPPAIQYLINSTSETDDLIIDGFEVLKVTGPYQSTPGLHRQHQAQPIHIYSEYRPDPYSDLANPETRTGSISHHYLRLRTKGGLTGLYGYIDLETVAPLLSQLRDFVLGKNAMAIETIWDQMYRRNRHSRGGHYMMALSAVDNALWDLRAKYLGVPVFELLGGPTREPVPVYGSCLGYTVEKGKAGPRAKELYDQGFVRQKWFLAYGPGDGAEGLKKNIELVGELREAVGDDAELMFDAFMGWDVPYANAWAKAVEKYRPYWIEEAFAPNRLDSFRQLSADTTIPVATGEHFYNRWEVQQFLDVGAIQIVQADPEWCGGVSELVKICHLASSFGAKVIPHGHNIHSALHVVASQSPEVCPFGEYLIRHVGYKLHFQKDPLITDNGMITLSEKPGFAIELDAQKVESEEVLTKLDF